MTVSRKAIGVIAVAPVESGVIVLYSPQDHCVASPDCQEAVDFCPQRVVAAHAAPGLKGQLAKECSQLGRLDYLAGTVSDCLRHRHRGLPIHLWPRLSAVL